MKLHRHAFKEDKTWRGFVRLWGKKSTRFFEGQLEITTNKMAIPGFRFHLGDSGSETPIDGSIGLRWVSVYWGYNFPGLGKLCEKIGQGHKRDISLQFHDSQIWWKLWYDDDMGYDDHHKCDPWRQPKVYPWRWGRHKYRSWICLRNGNLEMNPLDAFWGHRYYDYRNIGGEVAALVPINQFPGDEYDVKFQLQKQTRGRNAGPAFARRRSDEGWVVDWDAGKGIPHRNHDWKGDNVLASAEVVDLMTGEDWVQQAVKSLIKRIEQDRIHYRYQPPRETTV